ncbi:MAG TPA: prephenate dehydratase [Polyangia bacterium]|jgi:chorismate mutase/prephenate dehydratase|nr:prephenate dehydratase [Polyangia bacterium]
MAKDPNVDPLAEPEARKKELAALRGKIDATDDEILRLLNQRAEHVRRVADLKTAISVPFYVPSRERQIAERLAAANPGPFPSESIRSVFQEIFSACLTLEKRVRVAYLGPEGTFSDIAVKKQFGLSARSVPMGTIPSVFEEVERGNADYGVVPVENTTEGMVTHTLDTFLDSDLKVCAEIALEVNMCLLARADVTVAQIERVYSIPIALAQVRRWLSANLPSATLVEARSTAEAARLAHDDARGAAVGSELAAKLNELTVLRRKIEDLAHNMTRFLVLGRDQADPTGRDKTSLLLVTRDEAGILYRVLGAFAQRGLNMTKIESRPSRRRAWEYVFFVDIDGHERDAPVAAAIADVRQASETIKVLGSYPRADARA